MPTGVVTTGLDLRGGITSIIAAAAIDPQQQDELVSRIEELVNGYRAPGDAARPADSREAAPGAKLTQAVTMEDVVEGDTFTRRARPTVVYAGLVFIFMLHVLLPGLAWLGLATLPENPPGLPTEFWWAWTGVVSVWMLGRSYEKVNRPGKLSALITGSSPK